MIQQPLQGINFNPHQLSYFALIQTLSEASTNPQALSSLRIFSSRDPNFHTTITDILINPQIPSSIKGTASSFLAMLIKQHLSQSKDQATFEIACNILLNSAIDLDFRISFIKCIKQAIDAKTSAKIEEIINLINNLWTGDIKGKILAMNVIEAEATANQSKEDFNSFVHVVVIVIIKELIKIAGEATAKLLEHWARSTLLVITKLVINHEHSFNDTSSVDTLSYLCSSQDFSQLLCRCYYIIGSGSAESQGQIDQMKNHVALLHYRLLTQVFKLDRTCTSAHFTDIQNLLPLFIDTIANTPYVRLNEQFCTTIVSIVNLCAKQKPFNHLFTTRYVGLVNGAVMLMKLDDTDVYNFQNEPGEFSLGLDEICDETTEDMLRGEVAKLLVSLCKHVDGAATYLFYVCLSAIQQRVNHQEMKMIENLPKMELDEALLVLCVIHQFLEIRDDFKHELQTIFLTNKQVFLTELTDIELGMLYFLFSYNFESLFKGVKESECYVMAASTPSEHPTVSFLGLEFVSDLSTFLTNSADIIKQMTERIKTQDLVKYQEIYTSYLNKIFNSLTQDDLIYISTVIMNRIEKEINENGNSHQFHQMSIGFNLLSRISEKRDLMKIDKNLRSHLKQQVYPLIRDPNFKCLDRVIEIFDDILISYKTPTLEEYDVLPFIPKIIEANGNGSIFFTLALFVRKMQLQENLQIILYLLEVIKLTCHTNIKMEFERRIEIGEGLLLLRLFLRKFVSVLPQSTIQEIINFIPTIKIDKSQNLQAIKTNVLLKIFPKYNEQEFKNQLIQFLTIQRSIFFGEQRIAAIQGLCNMLLFIRDKPSIIQVIRITAELLEDHRLEIEVGKKANNKKEKSPLAEERHELTKSAKKMVEGITRQDVFVDFRNAMSGMKAENSEFYNSVVHQLPQHEQIKLRELLSLKEVVKELRVINRVKREKEDVVFDGQEQKLIKRKRAKDEDVKSDDSS